MRSPGRPKTEYRSAQREGEVHTKSPGRPKTEYRSAQREGEVHTSTPLQIAASFGARGSVDSRASPAASAKSSSAHIAAWLLSQAQICAGPHAGGVAGCLDADGRAEYVYPEITGYYLHWLAWYSATAADSTAIGARAVAAQRWLARWLATAGPPATRVHLKSGDADWRNGALFFFDYAMLLRGLALACGQGVLVADPMVVERLGQQLTQLLARDGMFSACVATQQDRPLPDRWSTRRGGFLAKAAAGILIAGREFDIAPQLLQAADATFVASIRWAVESPHAHTHPLLYTIEGVLSIPGHPACPAAFEALAPQLRTLFAAVETGGTVPESLDGSGTHRIDVVAQALRIGSRLRASGYGDLVAKTTLRQLARRLVSEVRSDGALPFDARQAPTQYNVWAAMFAQQALAAVALEGEHEDVAALSLPPALGLT